MRAGRRFCNDRREWERILIKTLAARILDDLSARAIIGFAKALTGVRALWQGTAPLDQQRVYYGNHSSHGDFVLIWASLPRRLRAKTRPVAGGDYWLGTPLKRYIATRVINAVLIDREKSAGSADPVATMTNAINEGASLIVFPEGTRNTTEAKMLPFKSGIFHLARQCPEVELVPVWIENLNRVMPKGELLPLPLLCTTTFGEPITLQADETKDAFIERTRNALLALAPTEIR